ncbi:MULTISPECIES: hypothetical protein [Streptomyces]|uniref:Uncharacterized protein n=1 Tax=Streptomyces heilongjiangensis TaxID=945052 RepID=A0ABW1B2P6_9ACTN|nr:MULTISPECIES: hypothetical protein [Streptomyces]MDC2948682.1 hypothetical protein [Streptomyces heilongjiangensis]
MGTTPRIAPHATVGLLAVGVVPANADSADSARHGLPHDERGRATVDDPAGRHLATRAR